MKKWCVFNHKINFDQDTGDGTMSVTKQKED